MYTNDLKFEKTYIETESKMILNSIVVYIRNSGRLNLLMAKMSWTAGIIWRERSWLSLPLQCGTELSLSVPCPFAFSSLVARDNILDMMSDECYCI